MPGALTASCQQRTSYLSLSQSFLASSKQNSISDFKTSPREYSPSYSSCLSHNLSPLTFGSNASLDTLSLYPPSVSDSPMSSPNSDNFSFSSEIGDVNQETSHFGTPLRRPAEIAPQSFDNNSLHDTPLDHRGHIPRVLNTSRDYSPEFYPNSLLLSQPDGKNNWTLSLDPTISQPVAISESVGSESLSLLSSCASDEAIPRTFPSVSSTPRYNASHSLQPSSQDDMAKFNTSSDISMIVSSTSSVQQRQGGGTSCVRFDTGNGDLYFSDLPHGLVSHSPPDSVLDSQQASRSKNLIKKSKNLFGRFKKLFSPKGTISKDIHAHTTYPPKSGYIPPVSERRPFPSYQRYKLTKSTMSLTPSFGQSFSPEDTSPGDNKVDEKYTYEYHARPKTLKEIKSQRRFSLPLAFGTSSRVTTPTTKRKVTTSVSRPSQSARPMSIYIASQTETLNFAA